MTNTEAINPIRDSDTVAAYFVSTALRKVQHDPVRIATILHEAAIDPAWLQDPLHRVSAQAVIDFWLILTRELNDEFFAFDSHGMPKGSFAVICRHVIHEPDMGRALQQCLMAFRLFVRDIQGHLEIRGRRAVIVLKNQLTDPVIHHVAEEIFLSMVIGVMCWLTGRRLMLDRTQFGHHRPPHGADRLLWGPWISFGSAHTELEFDAQQLKWPVVRNFKALKYFLRTAPEGVVVRFRNRNGLSAKVYRGLRSATNITWPTQSEMAKSLQMNDSAFRRQLEREGFNYQAIKHQVRRAIAFELLAGTDMTISDIAICARFQEPSAFHRVFRQWTGMSPGQYRESSKPAG